MKLSTQARGAHETIHPDQHDLVPSFATSFEVQSSDSKEAPMNPNTTSPCYNPNARCAYHFESPGHDTHDCWALKNKVQDLIEAKEIEFDPPETPNVITAPMPKHDQGVNAVDDNIFFPPWMI